MAAGSCGPAIAMAARILTDTAAMLGAERLVTVTSSHVDGCLYHGDSDQSIPMSDVDKVRAAHPEITTYVYKAGHGFNCDERGSYDAASAKTALDRTMSFIAEYVGK